MTNSHEKESYLRMAQSIRRFNLANSEERKVQDQIINGVKPTPSEGQIMAATLLALGTEAWLHFEDITSIQYEQYRNGEFGDAFLHNLEFVRNLIGRGERILSACTEGDYGGLKEWCLKEGERLKKLADDEKDESGSQRLLLGERLAEIGEIMPTEGPRFEPPYHIGK